MRTLGRMFRRRRMLAFSMVAGVIAVVAAGATYATTAGLSGIPDADGVFHACVNNSSGEVKLVAATATCPAGTTAVSWSQRGPQGPDGQQGPPGTTKAWARIDGSGSITSSQGLGSATVTHPTTGVYCIRNLPFEPHVAVGTAGNGIVSDSAAPGGFAPIGYDLNVTAATLDRGASGDTFLGICDTGPPATTQVRVYVANPNGPINLGFSIFIDG